MGGEIVTDRKEEYNYLVYKIKLLLLNGFRIQTIARVLELSEDSVREIVAKNI